MNKSWVNLPFSIFYAIITPSLPIQATLFELRQFVIRIFGSYSYYIISGFKSNILILIQFKLKFRRYFSLLTQFKLYSDCENLV